MCNAGQILNTVLYDQVINSCSYLLSAQLKIIQTDQIYTRRMLLKPGNKKEVYVTKCSYTYLRLQKNASKQRQLTTRYSKSSQSCTPFQVERWQAYPAAYVSLTYEQHHRPMPVVNQLHLLSTPPCNVQTHMNAQTVVVRCFASVNFQRLPCPAYGSPLHYW